MIKNRECTDKMHVQEHHEIMKDRSVKRTDWGIVTWDLASYDLFFKIKVGDVAPSCPSMCSHIDIYNSFFFNIYFVKVYEGRRNDQLSNLLINWEETLVWTCGMERWEQCILRINAHKTVQISFLSHPILLQPTKSKG